MTVNDLIRRLSELPSVERELEVLKVEGVWIVNEGWGRKVDLSGRRGGTPW